MDLSLPNQKLCDLSGFKPLQPAGNIRTHIIPGETTKGPGEKDLEKSASFLSPVV